MGNKTMLKYLKNYEPLSDLIFTEPLAIPLSPILAAIRVRPNVITLFSLLAGLAGGIVFATGHWFWGALVFQFAYFCDCVDGKVARLRGMTSELGVKLELIADSVRKPSSFLGIAIFFYLNHQMLFSVLTGVAFVAHFGVHKLFRLVRISEYDLEFPNFHRKTVRRITPRMLNLYSFFDEQFIAFVIFPLIGGIIGMPRGGVWFLYGIAFTACLGLLKLVNSLNYRRKGRYDEIYQDWAGTGGNLDK